MGINIILVAPSGIDLSDDANLVTRGPASPALEGSVAEFGIISEPLLVRRDDGRYRVICGFRRIAAAARAGFDSIPCRIMKDLSPADELEYAISDNLSSRRPNHAEIAVMVRKLSAHFTVEKVVSDFLPAFGLARSMHHYRRYASMSSLSANALDALAAGTLPVEAAEKLCRFTAAEQDGFLEICSACRMGANLVTEMAAGIHDIAMARGSSFGAVLDEARADGILEDPVRNANEKSSVIRHRVLSMRRPEYEATLARFNERLAEAGVAGLSVNPFPFFEKDEISIALKASSPADIDRAVALLQKLLDSRLVEEFTRHE